MEALLIKTKNKTELQLISDLLKRMRIETKVLSTEEQEDLGLLQMMKEVDRTQKVSREKIFAKC
ncbi:MAG: hypothetical protein WCH34_04740 [Bacteroidota bacterium]